MKKQILPVLLIFCSTGGAFAGEKAPLPEIFSSAKTLYIDNQSKYADIADKAFDEFSKWGRYKVVRNKVEADLVLVIAARSWESGQTQVGTANVHRDSDDKVKSVSTYEAASTTIDGETSFQFLGPTGEKVWENTRQWGGVVWRNQKPCEGS